METETPTPNPIAEAALRSLRDIVEPAPVSWMPQTWGWLALALLLMLAAALFGLRVYRRYRANAYRRAAFAALIGIEEEIRNPLTRVHAIQSLAALLKRTALAAWPRAEVATLSGAAWVNFLKAHDTTLAGGLAQTLDDLEYREADAAGLPSNVSEDLVIAARAWIKRHHVSA